MDAETLFDYSGNRLKRLIPQIFKWNVGLMLVSVVITFFGYLFNESVEDAFLALLIGTGSAAIEIGVMYFWMLNLYAHAEQSDNTFRILRLMKKDEQPTPEPVVPPKPVVPITPPKPVVPVAQPAPKPVEAVPAPAPEKKPAPPAEKPSVLSFEEALSFALRFETDEGMCRQLGRMAEQADYAQHREELTNILEELPAAQRRQATESLLQKYS